MSKIQSKKNSGSKVAPQSTTDSPVKKTKKSAAATKTPHHSQVNLSKISFNLFTNYFSQLLIKLQTNTTRPRSIIKILGGLLAIIAIFLIVSKLLTDRYWPFTADSTEPFVRNTNFDQIFGQPAQPLTERQQIAQKAIGCLDEKMKDERGVYYSLLICNQNNACQEMPNNQKNTPPIWAKTKLFAINHDQKLLESILTDARNIAEKVNSIQNVIWNARFVAKMAPLVDKLQQAKAISITEKNHLIANLFYHRTIYFFDRLTTEEIDKIPHFNPDSSKFQSDLINKQYQSQYELPDKNNPDQRYEYVSSLASDFLARYQLTQEEIELKKANYFYQQNLELIKTTKNKTSFNDWCAAGITSLDFYNYYQNPEYLKIALILYQNRDLSASTLIKTANLKDKAMCAYFINQLFLTTNNYDYYQQKEILIEDFLVNHLNKNDKKWGADYCFENQTITMHNTPLKEKITYTNSLIIDLLLD